MALTVFNRPGPTRAVFAAIRAARPPRLFLFADGPADAPGVAEARAAVADVDWPCRVERDYSAVNLGCRQRQASAFSAVFTAVDQAILLEDDCLPQPGCLAWCQAMLDRYRDEPRVMMVTASNPLEEWQADRQSHHFAHYGSSWGWATWRRAWAAFRDPPDDHRAPDALARLARVLPDADEQRRHLAGVDRVLAGIWSTWDVQWEHARLLAGGLAVVPARNMVDNLGLGAGATHTGRSTPLDAVRRAYPAPSALRPPPAVAADGAYDRLVYEQRSGNLSPAGIALWADRLIGRGRAVQALAMVRGGQRRHGGDPALAALAARALAALGR
ncbi:hemolytic protein HlpA [Allostella humosa]|uniref:glycosyltransferase family 2 protein n=1 Tax=Stella humosa TaxID=94 RepID=UPI000F4CECC9|nr:glycosyltransferase family 2 protein [Stella humosa]BBK30819.1 hemolytic protein HlpA [Stella humosa]